ncbi:hypothetical protein PCE1_004781 [Barthelona sp. PCE]
MTQFACVKYYYSKPQHILPNEEITELFIGLIHIFSERQAFHHAELVENNMINVNYSYLFSNPLIEKIFSTIGCWATLIIMITMAAHEAVLIHFKHLVVEEDVRKPLHCWFTMLPAKLDASIQTILANNTMGLVVSHGRVSHVNKPELCCIAGKTKEVRTGTIANGVFPCGTLLSRYADQCDPRQFDMSATTATYSFCYDAGVTDVAHHVKALSVTLVCYVPKPGRRIRFVAVLPNEDELRAYVLGWQYVVDPTIPMRLGGRMPIDVGVLVEEVFRGCPVSSNILELFLLSTIGGCHPLRRHTGHFFLGGVTQQSVINRMVEAISPLKEIKKLSGDTLKKNMLPSEMSRRAPFTTGTLPLLDESTVVIDNVRLLSKKQMCNIQSVMEYQQVSTPTGTVLPCRVGMLCFADTTIEDLDIKSSFISRFDIVAHYAASLEDNVDVILADFMAPKVQKTTNVLGDLQRLLSIESKPVTFDPAAAGVLTSWYTSLSKVEDSMRACLNAVGQKRQPLITPRLIEGVFRLCQAYSRILSRTRVTQDMIKHILSLMKCTLFSHEQLPKYWESILINTTRNSRKKKIMVLLSLLQRIESGRANRNEIWQLAKRVGIAESEFDHVVERLNYEGHILQTGKAVYRIVK